jgi:hypothetical protein
MFTFVSNNEPMENQKPRPNLMDCIQFWKNKSVKEDKGGTFNLELYLAYLQAINTDCPTQANRSNVRAITIPCNF